MVRELWNTITLLFEVAVVGSAAVARRIALVTPRLDEEPSAVYFRSLKRLLKLILFVPLPIVVIAGFLGWDTVTIIGVLLFGILTFAIAVATAPLGILIDELSGNDRRVGQRYANIVMNVVWGELVLALYLVLIPIKNRPQAIPVLLLALILVLLGAYFGIQQRNFKRFVVGFSVVVIVFSTVSFFVPKTLDAVQTRFGVGKTDEKLAEIVTTTKFALPTASSAPTSKDEMSPAHTFDLVLKPGDVWKKNLDELMGGRPFAAEWSDPSACVEISVNNGAATYVDCPGSEFYTSVDETLGAPGQVNTISFQARTVPARVRVSIYDMSSEP